MPVEVELRQERGREPYGGAKMTTRGVKEPKILIENRRSIALVQKDQRRGRKKVWGRGKLDRAGLFY